MSSDLKPITTCECTFCESNPPGSCELVADDIAITNDGVLAVCGYCRENHIDHHDYVAMIDNLEASQLAEWGRTL